MANDRSRNSEDWSHYSLNDVKSIIRTARTEEAVRRQYANRPLPEKISQQDYMLVRSLLCDLSEHPELFQGEIISFTNLCEVLEERVTEMPNGPSLKEAGGPSPTPGDGEDSPF